MDCMNCGAPLRPRSNICGHCNTLNDVDLRAIHARERPAGPSLRACPRCEAPMQAIDLGGSTPIRIERCNKCLGLFFDPGELESLIDSSVRQTSEVDYQRIQQVIEEESIAQRPPTEYVKCPECLKLMNRKRHGSRAGVVVDRCKQHGVWLDGGELGQVLKWAQAGGRQHDAQKRAGEKKARERTQRAEGSERVSSRAADRRSGGRRRANGGLFDLSDLIDVVMHVID